MASVRKDTRTMKDKLSYMQLYSELETLNTSVYDALLHEDFEEFQSIINDFTASGIMEQEEFAAAREAYRYSSMPFTLDGIWISVDSRNPLDSPITNAYGLPIQELKIRNTLPVYAYLTENQNPYLEDDSLAFLRIGVLEKYKELYKDLYKDNRKKNILSIPLVDNVDKHQMTYIKRVTELAALRSKFCLTYDFSYLSSSKLDLIDNENLKKMPLPEKIEYLTQKFANLSNIISNKKDIEITDYFSFNGYEKILASNYIQGKRIDRKNWKNYTKGTLPKLPLFYLELAFYLSIPCSDEIEKFMNLHGYSIKSPMTSFQDISFKNKTYHILHRDLCRWIDAGIDYNLINEICGFPIDAKEMRKPKAK